MLEGCLAHLQQPATAPLPSILKKSTDEDERRQSYSTQVKKGLVALLSIALVATAIFTLKDGSFSDATKPDQESSSNARDSTNGAPTTSFPPAVHAASNGAMVEVRQQENRTAEETEFENLNREYEQLSVEFSKALEQARNDEEVRFAFEKQDPRELMPMKFLAFEEKHRGSSIALKALTVVSNMVSPVGDPDSDAAIGRNRAFDRLIKHYITRDDLEPTISRLSGGLQSRRMAISGLTVGWQSPRLEEFLRLVLDRSPHKSVRANALMAQIRIDRALLVGKATAEFPEVKARYQETIDHASELAADSYRSVLKQFQEIDPDLLRKQLNEKLQLLWKEYADVEVRVYGTMGNASHRSSHAINKVVVGEQAPELTATDLYGKSFTLSDYKGKIVVLLFTTCGQYTDFKEIYAPFRKLVAKYKSSPVCFVGVMANSKRPRLLEAVSSGQINWTVISELINGPIQLNWGIEAFSYAYIIDMNGVLNPKLHVVPNNGESGFDTTEADQKIEQLLQRAAKENSKQLKQ